MLERDRQAAPHEPGVEGVMAVLDKHRAARKAKECLAHVSELRGADQHGTIDLVAPASIWVDRSSAVHQRVEERKRAVEPESLGPDLEYQEGRCAGGVDVKGHEMRLDERRVLPELWRIDCNLRPRHGLHRAAGLEQHRLSCPAKFRISRGPLGLHHLASASALRANAISSAVTARSSKAAPA